MISQVLAKLVTLVISKEDKKKVMRRKRSSSNVWQNQVIRVDILFWCDWVAAKDTSGAKRPPPAKREWHEEEVVDIFEEVKRKHKDFETTKLCLWARMTVNGIHESTDDPPDVPMIPGIPPNWPKWESVHDAVVDAAKTVMKEEWPVSKGINLHIECWFVPFVFRWCEDEALWTVALFADISRWWHSKLCKVFRAEEHHFGCSM